MWYNTNLVWVKSLDSAGEPLFSPEKVRPGEDDGSIKLTNSHIKHSISNQSITSRITLIPNEIVFFSNLLLIFVKI